MPGILLTSIDEDSCCSFFGPNGHWHGGGVRSTAQDRPALFKRSAIGGDGPIGQRLLVWSGGFSKQGNDIYEEIVPLARAVESKLVTVLDGDERRALDDMMRKLQARARDLP